MRNVHLRTLVLRDQPVTRDGHSAHVRRLAAETLLPRFKINGARIRRQHDELRERELRPIRDVDGRLERGRTIARESEDEGTKDMNAVLAERAETRDQRLADVVEVLVHVL
jgi:hypothetical protein